MKKTIGKHQAYKLLMFYTDSLHEKFKSSFITPATKELMSRHLIAIQNQQIKNEPQNPLWKLNVEINFIDDIKHIYEVQFANNELEQIEFF